MFMVQAGLTREYTPKDRWRVFSWRDQLVLSSCEQQSMRISIKTSACYRSMKQATIFMRVTRQKARHTFIEWSTVRLFHLFGFVMHTRRQDSWISIEC